MAPSIRTRNNAAAAAASPPLAPADSAPRYSSYSKPTSLSGRSVSPKPIKRLPNQPFIGKSPTSIASQIVPLAGLTILALVVRLWKIGQPSSVVFDEVHFGGFASKYINRKFFMDVHPPLAKLLIAGTAHLFNFDGKFDFKDIASEFLIGDHQPVPYVAMRLLPAFLGVALIPLCYLTLRALSMRGTTALVGSVLLLFDNAMATQSRLILLDSFLVFFTASTVFCWIEFCNTERRRAFTINWWAWLASTGFFLGCVVSTKWVGLFTIASIGVATVTQLWNHLGNIHLPMSVLWKHFIARGACLLGIPLVVYLATFAVHLGVLNHSGDGDAFMSSAFQHTLIGHGMPDTFADVALGSTITLRHLNTQGGLLHSHSHNYPAGSLQQQITLYPHIDENNEWLVLAAPGPDDPPTPVDEKGVPLTTDGPHEVEKYKSKKVQALLDGMEIRLVHRKTDKRLHSHEPHRPPVTESDFQNEVTAYGFPGFAGDANDNWKVEIEYATGGDSEASNRVRSLRTIFRLRHTLTGCYLFSHKIALPDWGFGQQEVTCNKSPTMPNSLWYVETSTHPRLSMHGNKSLATDEEGEIDNYAANPAQTINYIRPTFMHRFWELQKVMWETNAGLTERHSYDSRPSTWPTMKRGINFWSKDHRQVYLLGNPIVWWGSTVAVLVYVGTRALLMLRAKRGAQDFLDSTIVFYDRTASFLFISYSLHFFPFFLMSRQLFIHHYLPALYFAVLLLALLFDLLTAGLRPRFRLAAATALIVVVVWAYAQFAPLTYAGEWTSKGCEGARWLKTWDFNCREFPNSLSQYSTMPPGIQSIPFTAPVGAIEATASSGLDIGAPQPVGHAFEEVPKVAAESPLGEAVAPPSDPIAAAAPAPVEAVHVESPADGGAAGVVAEPAAPKEEDLFATIQTLFQPGDGVVEHHEATPSSASASEGGEAAHHTISPEGLDQDHVEEMVLGGTAVLAQP
ncbi:PMT-domain-containing protein [Microstroma glucosiphilum]|uniref:Dolichyl-phosphate-mannose--protein mannosyltransferase n=1 Tax=Pseudomicrostroma glucosiphilum TaxID=1684307 RepID=A0A316U1Q4_9BASI|nr:PMT-domain-containing protein [Pseudomicrostroma glucosiphilum]PWN19306.1 PMT-domain-containing protein [Pseudomicrostroma glucosiphilum]